jgi:hypothetical protein
MITIMSMSTIIIMTKSMRRSVRLKKKIDRAAHKSYPATAQNKVSALLEIYANYY